MPIIYIDTSVFESNNFFESKRINQILNLAEEGRLTLISPEITYKEIINRGKKRITEAFSNYKSYRDIMKSLRNLPSMDKKFDTPKLIPLQDEFTEVVKFKFKKAGVTILDYPTVNIGDVFSRYFNNEFPFHKGDKKHEFPDAFALLTVEEWCRTNHKTCVVFANDKDLLNYKSEVLEIPNSYEDYLDALLIRIEADKKREQRLYRARELFQNSKERLIEEVEDQILEFLGSNKNYSARYGHLVKEADLINVDVDLHDYQYISITDIHLDIEAYADVDVEIELEVFDDATGWYDDETGDWHYDNTFTEPINFSQRIPVTFRINIPTAGDEYMSIELEEINDGRPLYIP